MDTIEDMQVIIGKKVKSFTLKIEGRIDYLWEITFEDNTTLNIHHERCEGDVSFNKQ